MSEVQETVNKKSIAPAVDIYESDEKTTLFLDMPGIGVEDVEINLEKDVLTITGNVSPTQLDGYELAYREFGEYNYFRQFTINRSIDFDSCEASMKNGRLKLVLPKVKPRSIKLNVKAE
ncbi:MAG: Hsp20/alpha crystallin family protein [Leptospiraceae bacterium]|nr:Hsp20/alpha crystallin family protein [Leptospiraceae bacterium]MCP5500249.1 Hsp20/alpha crystallin family protein [Leptospiraceae bacterium]